MKLKTTEIKQYRETQLSHQNHKCALCGEAVGLDAVLDHCHKTGLIRKVLHRGCNTMLGKIENNMPRSQMTRERLGVFARNLLAYISTQHTDVLHPTHLTKEERNEKLARKRKQNRKKQKEAKASNAKA
jgi:hypothetical protein